MLNRYQLELQKSNSEHTTQAPKQPRKEAAWKSPYPLPTTWSIRYQWEAAKPSTKEDMIAKFKDAEHPLHVTQVSTNFLLN